MKRQEFETQLVAGHKGVTVVMVPFDPEAAWSRKPVRLDPRRDGWLITGTANGVRFDGYIGYRWGRFFIIIDPKLREAAGVSMGDISTGSIHEWTKETLKAGDQITVCGWPLRPGRIATIPEKEAGLDASRVLWSGGIILPEGKRLEFLPNGAGCPAPTPPPKK